MKIKPSFLQAQKASTKPGPFLKLQKKTMPTALAGSSMLTAPILETSILPRFTDLVFEAYVAFTYAANIRAQRALKWAGFKTAERFTEDGLESVYLEYHHKEK